MIAHIDKKRKELGIDSQPTDQQIGDRAVEVGLDLQLFLERFSV